MTERIITREMRRQLKRDNARYPAALVPVPMSDWPQPYPDGLIEVYRSRDFLVQIFDEHDGIERMSVARTDVDPESGRWRDGIEWDDLQRLKRECGRGDREAVEIYPMDRNVINVANMRHLWILRHPLPFGWRRP